MRRLLRVLSTTTSTLLAAATLLTAAQSFGADSERAAKPSDADLRYPTRTVRLVVPFAAGGGSDIAARAISQKVSAAWGTSLVVDNRPGGGGTLGAGVVAKAPPDGYTLLLTSVSIAYAPALYRDLPFDMQKELAPVLRLVSQPSMLVVHPTLPVKSLKELIALARAHPGEIRYSSGGSGSAPHLATELLRSKARINLVHVPYKGGATVVTAVMTGEVQMLVAGVVSLLPHVKASKLRALAVTGERRAKAVPDLPTLAEAGLPGAEFDGWYGLLVPAATPPALVARINADFNRALAASDLQERLAAAGFETLGGSAEAFAAYIRSESRKWTQVIANAKIAPE